MEFPVRVRNYTERHLFASDHPDRPTITQYWNQGAGINVVICGYTTQLPILLQLKYLAFLELYMTRHSTCYTNDHITFSHNSTPADLVRHFVEQLNEYNGCCVSTAEIIMKYYRALSASHEKLRRRELKKNASSDLTTVDEPVDKVHYEDVLSVIRSELVDDNIESSVGIVDDIYKKSFEKQYKDFTVVNDYLVERKDILAMYQSLVDLFPFIHSVLALTVSHKRYDLVQLSTMIDRTSDARHATICKQVTVSMAFDNWQQMIKKTWQTNGCSGNYLKGVASFIKKDKAIVIPTGSVLQSPSGILFKTTSCRLLELGELVTNIYPLPCSNDSITLRVLQHFVTSFRE